MKYSKAVDYALHIVVQLIEDGSDKSIGVQRLASELDVSPTYLAKILSILVKSGVLRSSVGVNGGYSLARPAEDITFMDVIRAVEGSNPLFSSDVPHRDQCRVQQFMLEAESRMFDYLEAHKIIEVFDEPGSQTGEHAAADSDAEPGGEHAGKRGGQGKVSDNPKDAKGAQALQ